MRQVVSDVLTSRWALVSHCARSVFSSHKSLPVSQHLVNLVYLLTFGGLERINSVTQTAFIVITKPTNKAGQLKFSTIFGAANSIATVNPIFTASHRKKLIMAAPAFTDDSLLVNPRANIAAGIITAKAPYAADQPILALPMTPQAINATNNPTIACTTKTRHGDTDGCFSRKARASSAVNGLNSGSSASCSLSRRPALGGAIFVISHYTQLAASVLAVANCHKASDYT
jgi:hypothetical protein